MNIAHKNNNCKSSKKTITPSKLLRGNKRSSGSEYSDSNKRSTNTIGKEELVYVFGEI